MTPLWALVLVSALAVQDPPPEKKDEPTVSPYLIPAIATGKNEGTTLGLLAALLFSDEEGRVNRLLAAELAWRELVGINGFVDYRYYPTRTALFEAFGSLAERVESDVDVLYDDERFGDVAALRAEFHESRVATDRFYGRGLSTPRSAESVLTSNQYVGLIQAGPHLSDNSWLQGTLRVRDYRVGPSLLTHAPQTLDAYPDEPGIEGGLVVAEGLRIVYDGRDLRCTPTRGIVAQAGAEAAHDVRGGRATPFQGFWLDGTLLMPFGDEAQFVSVIHARARWVIGNAPFWELPSLGGSTSLRSYGNDRFTDRGAAVLNFEERIRVATLTLLGTTGEVQVAPFVDLGEMFERPSQLFSGTGDRRLHYSYGAGLRGVVKPSIVGRVDAAYGREGFALLVGIDYPF